MIRLQSDVAQPDGNQFDLERFGEFYNYYFPKIYNYVRFRIRDPHDTDDLTSKIFERVIKNARHYDSGRGTFSAWIFAIANHSVIDYFKAQTGQSQRISFDVLNTTISNDESIEREIIDQELRNHLLAALQQIDDSKRAIVTLKFWSGLSNRQIAEMTGLTESNVGVTLYRTLKQLRLILAKQGVDIHG